MGHYKSMDIDSDVEPVMPLDDSMRIDEAQVKVDSFTDGHTYGLTLDLDPDIGIEMEEPYTLISKDDDDDDDDDDDEIHSSEDLKTRQCHITYYTNAHKGTIRMLFIR